MQWTKNGMIPSYVDISLANLCVAVWKPYKQANRHASDEQELGRQCVIQERSPQALRLRLLKNPSLRISSFLFFGPRLLAPLHNMH